VALMALVVVLLLVAVSYAGWDYWDARRRLARLEQLQQEREQDREDSWFDEIERARESARADSTEAGILALTELPDPDEDEREYPRIDTTREWPFPR